MSDPNPLKVYSIAGLISRNSDKIMILSSISPLYNAFDELAKGNEYKAVVSVTIGALMLGLGSGHYILRDVLE